MEEWMGPWCRNYELERKCEQGTRNTEPRGQTTFSIKAKILPFVCISPSPSSSYGYTYMHTYIYKTIHTSIHTYNHTYIHTYIHTCINACIHLNTSMRIFHENLNPKGTNPEAPTMAVVLRAGKMSVSPCKMGSVGRVG